MSLAVAVRSHPLLDVAAFVTRCAQPLGDLTLEASGLREGDLRRDGDAAAVRELLRAGGFKPSGRNKPASEYLVAAHAEGRFPAINAAVDACNLASLHGGLPISLVDLDLVSGELHVACAPAATSYVFNPSGQTIDASHLLCLFDAVGPTGTPVKDAQRTKTHAGTRATLSLIWGTRALPGRAAAVAAAYRALVARISSRGAPGDAAVTLEDVALC